MVSVPFRGPQSNKGVGFGVCQVVESLRFHMKVKVLCWRKFGIAQISHE